MRLINVETQKLENFTSRTPPYAILSHTWGAEEVTFSEIQSQPDTDKDGWRKIMLSCKQAKDDGYRYVWCDTCCIDKSSSAELSESINSMFRWYQEAEVCYVFLQDIQHGAEFSRAKWFTRGWCLQELIAPKRLNFYGPAWQAAGTRHSWAPTISFITGIDMIYLRGEGSLSHLHKASFAKRVSWAANRITTRDEDIAYCLMGLLNVNMPLLYGEGGTKAFGRLQEEYLRVNVDHSFLAWLLYTGDRFPDRVEYPNTPDGNLLATHPKDFHLCKRISLSNDDVAPFSLNNKGLRIDLPLFQSPSRKSRPRRSPEYFAVLACHSDEKPEARIRIPLRAKERSAKTFAFLPSEMHHAVATDEFDSARLTECFILRNPKLLAPRMLSVSDLPASLVSWKPKVIYFDISTSTWICLSKPSEPRIPLIQVPSQREQASYGVLFDPPSSNPDNTSSDCKNPSCLKVLIRVDVGFEERYGVNVRIQLFHVAKDEISTDLDALPSIPSAETSSNSRSQIVSMPTQPSETVHASASWKRISSQDVLSLNIDLAAVDKHRAHGLGARSISAFKSLFTEDPLVHGIYTTIVVLTLSSLGFSTMSPCDTIAWGIFSTTAYFGRRKLYPGEVWQVTRDLQLRLPLVPAFLLMSYSQLVDYYGSSYSRYRAAVYWLLACWDAVCVLWILQGRTGYEPTYSERISKEELDSKTDLRSLLLDVEGR
jgi:hypothetical protein